MVLGDLAPMREMEIRVLDIKVGFIINGRVMTMSTREKNLLIIIIFYFSSSFAVVILGHMVQKEHVETNKVLKFRFRSLQFKRGIKKCHHQKDLSINIVDLICLSIEFVCTTATC